MFYQNPFSFEFRGNLPLDDRQYSLTFTCPAAGRGDEVVFAWTRGPYNLSGNDGDGDPKAILNINYSFAAQNYKDWKALAVNITTGAGSISAVTADEIVAALNGNTAFSNLFLATVSTNTHINITQKKPADTMRFYIGNAQAETILRFNARAGVAELPSYFSRHRVFSSLLAAEIPVFTDNANMLVLLDTAGSVVDTAVVNNAVSYNGVSLGYSASTVQEDWQLLRGRASGLFRFYNKSSSSTSSTTTEIIYPAGAKLGDLAKKVIRQLDGSGNELRVYELPHTLTGSDLITPP